MSQSVNEWWPWLVAEHNANLIIMTHSDNELTLNNNVI